MSKALECYLCGLVIDNESELVVETAGWEEEFSVPCHFECVLDTGNLTESGSVVRLKQ